MRFYCIYLHIRLGLRLGLGLVLVVKFLYLCELNDIFMHYGHFTFDCGHGCI